MIPYTQLNGKITTSETVRVTSCVCKSEDSSEKFRFVVHGDELNQVKGYIFLQIPLLKIHFKIPFLICKIGFLSENLHTASADHHLKNMCPYSEKK